MSHLQFMPGDPRLVDQLVCELKSKGIFDQFRKECIADVDTRPAYQNLRQRVESSVASFLSRQCWKPDLNKNQLREKLRKHLLDGNYLEQGVERIVDQVVNPKVASVFIPQVEDLVYNYLGIPRKKSAGTAETSNEKTENNLLPTDLEAVSPGSVKSNDDKSEPMDTSDSKDDKMDIDEESKIEIKDDLILFQIDKEKIDQESRLSGMSELTVNDSESSIDKSTIPLPAEIKLENIPAPENSPPNIKSKDIDLEKIDLPKEPNLSTDIPLPDEIPKIEKDVFFKPINSEGDDSSSDSSLRRNMSPLTPIRNFNNENSCDAQQGFDNNDSDSKSEEKKEPTSFRFTIELKSSDSSDNIKPESKEETFQTNQPAINTFNTPMYDDSSNSNNLQIDYESDANTKTADIKLPEPDHNSGDSKKDKKEDRKSSHKSSHRSRDSSRHSSSKHRRSDSKQSSSRDSSRYDKKSSKDDKNRSSRDKSEKSERKDSRDSSKHRSSSHKSSSHKDSKQRSSSSSKHAKHDDKKSTSSSYREKEKSSEKSTSEKNSKDKYKDSKSSSHRSGKDKKSSRSKSDEKENKEKKDKKETDDHYGLSGRGNPNRRSTDRDSNDGSSSSKGSHNPTNSKSTDDKKESKSSSKSGSASSSDSTSPSDKDNVPSDSVEVNNVSQSKPIVRVETHLETPVSTPPRLPFVPDVTLKKPRFAANLEEAKKMMKMRKFLEEEQKRMNQEAALLLEFQANVRPSLSQVYSSISGPELEFACVSNTVQTTTQVIIAGENSVQENVENDTTTLERDENIPVANIETSETTKDMIAETLIAMHQDHTNVVHVSENLTSLEVPTVENEESILLTLSDEMTNNVHKRDKKIFGEAVKKNVVEKIKRSDAETRVVQNKTRTTEEDTEDIQDVGKTEKGRHHDYFEVTIITEELSENEERSKDTERTEKKILDDSHHPEELNLLFFEENEKYKAELERNTFEMFLKKYTERYQNKLHLINCDTYEENIMREAARDFGEYQIINYYKNGHVKLPKQSRNIVKNVNVAIEITLPTKTDTPVKSTINSPVFSPVKSECSFELCSDYDAKLEDMVNNTSRKEIMEIILGSVLDESPTEMPRIDYYEESNIGSGAVVHMKRKIDEIETHVNNNRPVLSPNKMRKLSGSDQISSTTGEVEDIVVPQNRSKYLGKARRVGLPKPKRTTLPNSPSSDKSVENYEQDTSELPNGKIKATPRSKVQRYDTSDLYKPKLHYLSRRNNIT